MSSVMPALSLTSIWPRPLPTVFGSSALKSLGESWRRAAVLEVESSADLAARLVQSVGELGRVELGDDVEGVFRHYWCELKIAFRPTTTAAIASAIPATEEIASSAPMPAVPSSSDSSGGLS